jgi:hypothetical protein
MTRIDRCSLRVKLSHDATSARQYLVRRNRGTIATMKRGLNLSVKSGSLCHVRPSLEISGIVT